MNWIYYNPIIYVSIIMGLAAKILFAFSLLGDNCCPSDYTILNLVDKDDRNVCEGKYTFKPLELKDDKSIIFKYVVDLPNWDGKTDFKCIVHINAPDHRGIFAVVQEMSLRKERSAGKCIDYIQFRQADRSPVETWTNLKIPKQRSWGPQICGDISPLKIPYTDTDADGTDEDDSHSLETPSHAFMDRKGPIEVKIFISRKKPKSDETLQFLIAFTPFSHCEEADANHKYCGLSTCIPVRYEKDKIVNCPFLTTSNCVDEECTVSEKEKDTSKEFQTEIAAAAVVSVLVSFIVFLGCMMLCRYMELCAGSSSNVDRGTELSQVEPSAPPLVESPDKDLPPSYETLFPR